MKVDWSDVSKLKSIIASSNNRKQILTKLGFNYHSIYEHRRLNNFIKQHEVDISHFNKIPEKWKLLPSIINECYSYADVLKALNLSLHGSNNETVKRYIEHFKLDISHFYPTGVIGGSTVKYTNKEVFCKNSKTTKSVMRGRYLKIRKDTYHCDICNLTTWQGENITLEIDHKNGDDRDHRLVNLRLLCPNCHSQTETYGSRKPCKHSPSLSFFV